MPTANPFTSLFGRSPFKPMQEHMRVVTRCAGEIPGLFEALCDRDFDQVEAIKDTIFALENEADSVKNEMRAHLPKSLLMPVDRRDLLELLDLQDCIADTAQDIARLLSERRMEVHPSMCESLFALTRRSIDACEHSAQIIEKLDELVATGFRGRESEKVSLMADQLNKIETDTDDIASELTRTLFAHENEMTPVSVILWYQLIQWIGNLADFAEKVGNRLRLLVAH